jgi:23S rRNA U2552 (ribose-2'-O)-methylase RlmE/FtsJ
MIDEEIKTKTIKTNSTDHKEENKDDTREKDLEEGPERNEDTESFFFDQLDELKKKVPHMKETLGWMEWERRIDGSKRMKRRRDERHPCTKAFYKLEEMLIHFDIEPFTTSLHLCEAPGSFIQASEDYLLKKGRLKGWNWVATSLKNSIPFSSTLPKNGSFLYYDIMDSEESDRALEDQRITSLFEFVTADGASDMDHSSLEISHIPLLLSQTNTALSYLKEGGTLIIKWFEGRESTTKKWMLSMTLLFENVFVCKPKSSKLTNSERYLVCLRRNKLPSIPLSHSYLQSHSPEKGMKECSSHIADLAKLQSESLQFAMKGTDFL